VERCLDADTSDHAGPALACACGATARYAGRRARTLITALGELRLTRAWYHCDACEHGFAPRDRALGVADSGLSPAVTRMVGLAAAMVSFAESSELLAELAGVSVDAKGVERSAEALGREIAADERSLVEPAAPCAPTMYLGMDGTGVPLRPAELAGRAGKGADGQARTREVKLVTVWSAEGRDPEGIPVRDPGSVSWSGAIESAATRIDAGTVSFVDWLMFTWSFGCTGSYAPRSPPSSSFARFAITSFAFMLCDVPAPAWNTSTTNWSRKPPSTISRAARSIASARRGSSFPSCAFAFVDASFTSAVARTIAACARIPEI